MIKILSVLFFTSLFQVCEASSTFWRFGEGPGSSIYWKHGEQAGSKLFWDFGETKGSKLYWDYGEKPGSKLYWQYGDKVGSKFFWDFGEAPGSKFYWEYGDGPGSKNYWRHGDGMSFDKNFVALCMSGSIDIEPCRMMANDLLLTQLQQINSQSSMVNHTHVFCPDEYQAAYQFQANTGTATRLTPQAAQEQMSNRGNTSFGLAPNIAVNAIQRRPALQRSFIDFTRRVRARRNTQSGPVRMGD